MPGMTVGYARTSTADQVAGFEAQLRDLQAAGCEKIFKEQVSSVANSRAELKAALDFLREGDTLVVTRPDRLARSTMDLLQIVKDLKARNVGLRVLSMGLDTRNGDNPTATLTLSILASIAEFERSLMLERQREGIAKAKAAGKYKGRPVTVAKKRDEMLALLAEGVGPAEIARRLGTTRTSVYRIVGKADMAAAGGGKAAGTLAQ